MPNKHSAFFGKELIDFIVNLYNKLRHGLGLTKDEEEVLEQTPDDVLEEVDQIKEQEETPEEIPIEPRVKRVLKKRPTEKKLTQEETDELLAASPEMTVLNQFFPDEVFDDSHFDEKQRQHIDTSINTFLYLREFGYKNAMWVIGPEHKATRCHTTEWSMGYPICDYLATAQLTLDNIIKYAQEFSDTHGFYPPKAIIAFSHPGCLCHLICWPPNSPEEIPDSAPGVPTFGSPEEILYYKQQIFPNLKEYPVDRWTVLSPLVYAEANQSDAFIVDEADVQRQTPYVNSRKSRKEKPTASLEEERFVYADSAWVEDIQPIRISHSYLFRSSMGPIRPIPSNYIGFQLSVTDNYAIVFLGNLSRTIIAPRNCIEIINLRPVFVTDVDSNSFIRIDDSYGLAIRVLEDGKVMCYLPDFDEMIAVYPESVFKAS